MNYLSLFFVRTIDEARRNVEEKHSQLQEIHEDGHQPIDSDVKVESFDNMGEKDLELYLIPNGSTNHSKSLHDTTRCESLHVRMKHYFVMGRF